MQEDNLRNKRRLTQEQFYQLCEAMKSNEEWFKQNCPTFTAGAKFLEGKTGFLVPPNAIPRIQKLTKVMWEQPRAPSSKSLLRADLEQAKQTIAHLVDDNQKLHAHVDVLRGLVHELYWNLGSSFPKGYEAPPDPLKRHAAVNSRR